MPGGGRRWWLLLGTALAPAPAQPQTAGLSVVDDSERLSPNVGAGCGAPLAGLRCEAALLDWVNANGGTVLGVRPAVFGGRGRGLVATVAAAPGAAVLTVPRSLQMSYVAACESDFAAGLGLCTPPAAAAPQVALALWLMHERYRGPAGRWWPYIAALPAAYPATAYTELELAALDDTVAQPHLVEVLRAGEGLVADALATIRALRSGSRRAGRLRWLPAGPPPAGNASAATPRGRGWVSTAGLWAAAGAAGRWWGEADVRWAIATIKSRAWDDEPGLHPQKPSGAPPWPALVPVADLLNHRSLLAGPAAVAAVAGAEDNGLELLLGQRADGGRQLLAAGGGLAAGEEVFDRYLQLPAAVWRGGPWAAAPRGRFRSAAQLVAAFGFLDEAYPLPLSLLAAPPDAPAVEPAAGSAEAVLAPFGCLAPGFLPLGTGAGGWLAAEFARRMLGCLRLDCAVSLNATALLRLPEPEVAGGAAPPAAAEPPPWPWRSFAELLAPGGVAVERCATEKAVAQIGAELAYYDGRPAARPARPSSWLGVRRLERERGGRRAVLAAVLNWERRSYAAVHDVLLASAAAI
jgi:hypothetical protein